MHLCGQHMFPSLPAVRKPTAMQKQNPAAAQRPESQVLERVDSASGHTVCKLKTSPHHVLHAEPASCWLNSGCERATKSANSGLW